MKRSDGLNPVGQGQAQTIATAGKAQIGITASGSGNGDAAIGTNHIGAPGSLKQRHIGLTVAAIVEGLPRETAPHRLQLGVALVVAGPVTGQHLIENLQMSGDVFGKQFIGRRGQHDEPPVRMFASQPGDKAMPIRQGNRIDRADMNQRTFESGAAAQHRKQSQQTTPRVGPQTRRKTLPEQIGANQRAIEVDDQHRLVDIGFGRGRQRGRRTRVV